MPARQGSKRLPRCPGPCSRFSPARERRFSLHDGPRTVSLALLGALLIALFALYGADSDDSIPHRLLGPIAVGLMTAGLLMATLFLLTLLRFDQINKMIRTLEDELPGPPPEPPPNSQSVAKV
jgi:hypothetical protein